MYRLFTCISLWPIKVDVLRMKKLYNSEMNSSTYFCWPERNPEIHLSTKSSLNRTQSLKGRKSLSICISSTPVFQLNTHPLLHLRPQGITKILRELMRYRKVSIKNLQFVIYCSFAISSDSQDP